MKDITLAFSELAGRLDIEVSSADTPTKLVDSIVGKFESLKPIELSERERDLSLSFREAKIDRLRAAGVPPVITNRLVAKYCQGDLALSYDNDVVEFDVDLALDLWSHKVKLANEKTGEQIAKQPKSTDEVWAEKTKAMTPIS